MSDISNLDYTDFSAGYTAGECMTIIDDSAISVTVVKTYSGTSTSGNTFGVDSNLYFEIG